MLRPKIDIKNETISNIIVPTIDSIKKKTEPSASNPSRTIDINRWKLNKNNVGSYPDTFDNNPLILSGGAVFQDDAYRFQIVMIDEILNSRK